MKLAGIDNLYDRMEKNVYEAGKIILADKNKE